VYIVLYCTKVFGLGSKSV